MCVLGVEGGGGESNAVFFPPQPDLKTNLVSVPMSFIHIL